MINSLGCYQPVFMQPEDSENFIEPAARLVSKVRSIAAASYRKSIGRSINYPTLRLIVYSELSAYDVQPAT